MFPSSTRFRAGTRARRRPPALVPAALGLALASLGMCLTGDLLRWDQNSFSATKTRVSFLMLLPRIGGDLFKLAAFPAVLGLVVLSWLPESPRWLASRVHPIGGEDRGQGSKDKGVGQTHRNRMSPIRELFQRPLIRATLVGVVLASMVYGRGSNQRAVDVAKFLNETLELEIKQAHVWKMLRIVEQFPPYVIDM